MRYRILFLGIVALILAAAAALAQEPPIIADPGRFGNPNDLGATLKYKDYIYGVLKKVNKDSLIVDKTPYGDGQVFVINKKTKYVHDNKPSTLEALKPGDKIWINMKRNKKTDELLAQKVVTGIFATD
jgi:hypothetical protein